MKRTKLNKKSKRPTAVNRRICDYMWGTVIVLRDRFCKYCNKNPVLVGHHIFAKGECPATRYDTKIGIGLCGGCHEFKAHANPEKYRHINIKHVGGQKIYDNLFIMASLKCSPHDYAFVEIMLWQELGIYDVVKPEGWLDWSENKKQEWLRTKRKESRE